MLYPERIDSVDRYMQQQDEKNKRLGENLIRLSIVRFDLEDELAKSYGLSEHDDFIDDIPSNVVYPEFNQVEIPDQAA